MSSFHYEEKAEFLFLLLGDLRGGGWRRAKKTDSR